MFYSNFNFVVFNFGLYKNTESLMHARRRGDVHLPKVSKDWGKQIVRLKRLELTF